MGAGITFQLVYALAAIAVAWRWVRYTAASIFFAAFGAATTAKCYPQWLEVPAETREGEPVTLTFTALDAATLRDHFYGLSSGTNSNRLFYYSYIPPVPEVDADDELAKFMRPPVRRIRGIAHVLNIAGDGYSVLIEDPSGRGSAIVTRGSSSRIYV